MVKLYVDLEKALDKADADMQAAIVKRNEFAPDTDDFKYWTALVEAYRAMALSISQTMDNLLLEGGARAVLDQYNNGLLTLKETVDGLKAIEADLSL
jgi:hypothetical protein